MVEKHQFKSVHFHTLVHPILGKVIMVIKAPPNYLNYPITLITPLRRIFVILRFIFIKCRIAASAQRGYDVWARTVMHKTFMIKQGIKASYLATEDWRSGIYFVFLCNDSTSSVSKCIKE